MLKEFKEFAMRGNVVDMAVGIIIGVAFGKIVTSFVNDVIMPPIGLMIGNVDFSQLFVNVGTDYGADLDETRAVLERVANAAAHKLPDKDIQVALLELGDSAISWQVSVWAESANWWATKEELTRNIKVELDKAGVGIPFPQMDVHLNGKLTN